MPTTQLPPAIMVDLDGTLADVIPARHHMHDGRRDYEAFHTYGTGDAAPIANTVVLVETFAALGAQVLLVSGRQARWEPRTRDWLDRHHIGFDQLWMRPNDFKGKDADAKLSASISRDETSMRSIAASHPMVPDVAVSAAK